MKVKKQQINPSDFNAITRLRSSSCSYRVITVNRPVNTISARLTLLDTFKMLGFLAFTWIFFVILFSL